MTDAYQLARVLVPLDGSDCSRHAAQHAVPLARASGAALTFLHVIDGQIVNALSQHEDHAEITVGERLRDNAGVYLAEAAALAEAAGVAHSERIEQGDPATVIVEVATDLDADLIVMGRVGRRGARRILIGSITQRVIECSDCAVLVVSHPPRSDEAA